MRRQDLHSLKAKALGHSEYRECGCRWGDGESVKRILSIKDGRPFSVYHHMESAQGSAGQAKGVLYGRHLVGH